MDEWVWRRVHGMRVQVVVVVRHRLRHVVSPGGACVGRAESGRKLELCRAETSTT